MSDERPRGPFIDLEAARRRRTREADRRRRGGAGISGLDQEGDGDEAPVEFGWKDTLALIIAVYQILLPMVAMIVGALVVVYLLFRLLFH